MNIKTLETILDHTFSRKPLLIGGGAMEYYGLRERGEDLDFVIRKEDYAMLEEKHPDCRKEIFGDLGICKDGFELWQTIMLFDYDFLSQDAIEEEGHLVVSLEKLLFLKALGIDETKYESDLRLVVKKIIDNQYKKQAHQIMHNSL